MLHILSEKKKRAFYETQLGREKTVLWEDDVTEGQMHGWTENYVRVKAKYDPLRVNTTMLVNLQTFNEEGSVDVQEIDEILSHTLLHSQA
jgi:threonylcarbamoyladenosine tRNA methylthiotransferase MtaB